MCDCVRSLVVARAIAPSFSFFDAAAGGALRSAAGPHLGDSVHGTLVCRALLWRTLLSRWPRRTAARRAARSNRAHTTQRNTQRTRTNAQETQRLVSEPAPGISATPHENNLRYFDVVIAGPSSSPYEGGVFKLELFLSEDYPMAPPKVRFLTKIYHPNIDKLGRIW